MVNDRSIQNNCSTSSNTGQIVRMLENVEKCRTSMTLERKAPLLENFCDMKTAMYILKNIPTKK